MTRRTAMFPANSIGEVNVPTPRQTNSYQPRMPTIVTINVYVQKWPGKTRGRMSFTEKAPVYQCIQLDVIGTMTSKYFLADNVSPADQDGLTVKFPALTMSEAKDLARTVQDILDKAISPKKCKPITADILDVEIVAA